MSAGSLRHVFFVAGAHDQLLLHACETQPERKVRTGTIGLQRASCVLPTVTAMTTTLARYYGVIRTPSMRLTNLQFAQAPIYGSKESRDIGKLVEEFELLAMHQVLPILQISSLIDLVDAQSTMATLGSSRHFDRPDGKR